MIKIVDLFAGIGGIRLGFEQAFGKENIDCVFASEIDKFAVETYKANFGSENIHGDITKIDASDIPDHDILLAGFPCQPFSVAGLHKGFDDERGNAFFEIERILLKKRPKIFLLEKRTRSHDIVRKNPYASNAIDSIVSNCIGTGIKPQSKAKDQDFRRKIQDLWLCWTDEADSAGVVDFYGFQSLVLRSVIECGECFVRLKIDKKNATVPLKLQVLESEHLDSSKDQALPNGNIIRSGIEFDKTGKRVAYHLYKEHPGENSFQSLESVRIPASEILHIFKPLRPGQIRGEPWLSNVLLKLHDLDQYEDAELVRKKTAAMFAGFVTRLDPEDNVFGDQHDVGSNFCGLEPGTMQFLDPGEDVKFSSPADVGGTYEVFIKQQLRAISVGLGITYEQLTGDLSDVNYSSIRAGLVEFRRKCTTLQHNLIVFQLCRPIWNRWIELAILSDAIEVPDDPTFSLVKWIPQGFAWVDPLKEQNAQMNAVRCGFKSRAEVVSELGYDIEEIDAEISADNKRAKEMGLIFESQTNVTPYIKGDEDDSEITE